MKKLILAALFTIFAYSPFSVMAEEQIVTMNIEKMHCAMCPITVRKAMERVDGVQKVEVDYDSKTAVVTFDDTRTTVTEVAQASTNVGYPATPARDE